MQNNKIGIINYQEFDPSKITFTKPEYCDSIDCYSSQTIYQKIVEKDSVYLIQSPVLKIENIVYDSSEPAYYLYARFPKKTPQFYNIIYELEKTIIETIIKKSKKWFDLEDNMTKIKTENLLRSNIFPSDKLDEPPFLRIKIPIVDDNLVCNIFDKYENPITFKEVLNYKERDVVLLLCISHVKYFKDKILVDCIAGQIKLCNYPLIMQKEYLFRDEEIEEETVDIKDIDLMTEVKTV